MGRSKPFNYLVSVKLSGLQVGAPAQPTVSAGAWFQRYTNISLYQIQKSEIVCTQITLEIWTQPRFRFLQPSNLAGYLHSTIFTTRGRRHIRPRYERDGTKFDASNICKGLPVISQIDLLRARAVAIIASAISSVEQLLARENGCLETT